MAGGYSRILVTGGAGFVGSHLADRLLNEGFEVTVIDDLSTGRHENIAQHQRKDKFHFIRGDIRDLSLVRKTMKDIDAVFHEAALLSLNISLRNPILANDINVTGTLNLLKAASDSHVKRFIYASSAAVYGEASPPQKREDMTLNPPSPYGVSKLAAENYVRLFHKAYGLETVSLRYFNVYGPRQRFDIECAYGGAIAIFINRLLRNMSPVIFGDGKQTRDFVYIEEIVKANILALDSQRASGDTFNIGTGTPTSINQIAETIKETLNRRDLKNQYADPRPTDIRHIYANIEKARRILGYTPNFSINKGIEQLVDWYISSRRLS